MAVRIPVVDLHVRDRIDQCHKIMRIIARAADGQRGTDVIETCARGLEILHARHLHQIGCPGGFQPVHAAKTHRVQRNAAVSRIDIRLCAVEARAADCAEYCAVHRRGQIGQSQRVHGPRADGKLLIVWRSALGTGDRRQLWYHEIGRGVVQPAIKRLLGQRRRRSGFDGGLDLVQTARVHRNAAVRHAIAVGGIFNCNGDAGTGSQTGAGASRCAARAVGIRLYGRNTRDIDWLIVCVIRGRLGHGLRSQSLRRAVLAGIVSLAPVGKLPANCRASRQFPRVILDTGCAAIEAGNFCAVFIYADNARLCPRMEMRDKGCVLGQRSCCSGIFLRCPLTILLCPAVKGIPILSRCRK